MFSSEDALQIWLQSLGTLIDSSTSTSSTSCSSASSLSAPSSSTASSRYSSTQQGNSYNNNNNNNNHNNNNNNSGKNSSNNSDSSCIAERASDCSPSLQSIVESCSGGGDIGLQHDEDIGLQHNEDRDLSDMYSGSLPPYRLEDSVRMKRNPVISTPAVVSSSRSEVMAMNTDQYTSKNPHILTTGKAIDIFPCDHVSNSTPLLLSSSLTETTSIPAYVTAEDAVYASSSFSSSYNSLPLAQPIPKARRGRTAQIPVQCFSLADGQVRSDLALSVCLFVCVCVCPSVRMFICLFISRSKTITRSLPLTPSFFLHTSACMHASLSLCTSLSFSFYLLLRSILSHINFFSV